MDLLWLDDPACSDRSLVGGKIANLAALVGRYNVPSGFGITSRAIELSLRGATRGPGALPRGLELAVSKAYGELGTRRGSDALSVAVIRVCVNVNALPVWQLVASAGRVKTELDSGRAEN